MVIFFNFQTTSGHLHSLQVENCDSTSRLERVQEFRVERVKGQCCASVAYGETTSSQHCYQCVVIRYVPRRQRGRFNQGWFDAGPTSQFKKKIGWPFYQVLAYTSVEIVLFSQHILHLIIINIIRSFFAHLFRLQFSRNSLETLVYI